jgi:Rrf2 family iron-sulfur cluster assembly transcriptional regulator
VLCISSKGRFATRILVLLASGAADRVWSRTEIASAEGLTTGYVQQLMGSLLGAGLVVSHRGKQGGFQLARSPQTITMADALRLVEGPTRLAPCHDGEGCTRISTCPTRGAWVEAAHVLDEFFGRITIAQLAEEAERMGAGNKESLYVLGTI